MLNCPLKRPHAGVVNVNFRWPGHRGTRPQLTTWVCSKHVLPSSGGSSSHQKEVLVVDQEKVSLWFLKTAYFVHTNNPYLSCILDMWFLMSFLCVLGFDVAKTGDARIGFVGFPSVGKSTLLSNLAGVYSEVAAYEFTTLTTVPGVIRYKGAKIQVQAFLTCSTPTEVWVHVFPWFIFILLSPSLLAPGSPRNHWRGQRWQRQRQASHRR